MAIDRQRMLVCPFCGHNELFMLHSEHNKEHWISCSNCEASGPVAETEEAALGGWNGRCEDLLAEWHSKTEMRTNKWGGPY